MQEGTRGAARYDVVGVVGLVLSIAGTLLSASAAAMLLASGLATGLCCLCALGVVGTGALAAVGLLLCLVGGALGTWSVFRIESNDGLKGRGLGYASGLLALLGIALGLLVLGLIVFGGAAIAAQS